MKERYGVALRIRKATPCAHHEIPDYEDCAVICTYFITHPHRQDESRSFIDPSFYIFLHLLTAIILRVYSAEHTVFFALFGVSLEGRNYWYVLLLLECLTGSGEVTEKRWERMENDGKTTS
ncbi:hypothetical protein ALMA_0186 [Alloscardovia macacae]|uniref:Uncharacterized protein n=1 Tax=Alloscardovia macacae TaxID=1160091 RepID=A0A261F6U9_9BIFI|nr:hypothetical protein ALMA_0186 [Alloscardovia macacae]